MDIQRPSNARAKHIKRILDVTAAVLLCAGVTLALSRLKPAAPSVDGSTIWPDTVKRGPMLREVRGLGTLVPEDIHWIPAQTAARVDKIVIRPGHLVQPDTVILEMSNPELQRDVLDAEYALKAAEANYANLRLQHDVDEKLFKEGIGSDHTKNLSKVKEDQLAIRLKLESERTKIAEESAKSRLQAQQSQVDQAKATYGLRISQSQSLRVRAGITGVLQLVPVEEGQNVAVGTNVARVADPKKLKAEIKIAETQAKDIVIGQKATIDTRNGVVIGHVSRIDPSVQNGTVTVDAVFDEPLPPGARADLSVDGTIELENLKDVLYVGRPVHGQSDSTVGIFKLDEDGTDATRVNVKLGRSSVNTIEIVSGLKVGDKVILSDMSAWDSFDRIRLK